MSTKKYAVIGHPIGHSLSPFIHEKLFELDNIDAQYKALDIENLDTDYENVLKKLDGYNVTIPHKLNIINKLDKISDKASLQGSVNTVKNEAVSEGFTTDGFGFASAVKSKCGGIIPKEVLIFGYGGAARAIAYECIENGCKISFAVREQSINKCKGLNDEIISKTGISCDIYSMNNIPNDKRSSLLVNATPIGMYPNTDGCIANDDIIKNCDAVFDCVYNPLETVLLKKAREYKKNAIGSVEMLVYQAAKAHEIWVNAEYSDDDLQQLCRETENMLRFKDKKVRIALCGFMGCGKSTVANALSKSYGIKYIDTDKYIEESENMTISEIFNRFGENYFRDKEYEAILSLSKLDNIVLSLGGGAVMYKRNIDALKKAGYTLIFINTDLEIIKERLKADSSRPLLKTNEIDTLYNKRFDTYIKNSDINLVCTNESANTLAEKIFETYTKEGKNQ